MPTLVLTCGLPRSGKTTWAQTQDVPIVNPDSIRLALHGKPFISLAEPFVWAIAKVMVRALFLAGHDRVIVDATNTTRKRRDDWKSRDWTREFRVFGDASLKEECKRRANMVAQDTEHLIGLLEAIDRMADQWEPIADDELDDES
jgi:predicted kinase